MISSSSTDRRSVSRTLVALGVTALLAAASTSADAQSKCAGDKIKAAAKKASCKAALEAKQAGSGSTIDPAKVAKCEAAFSKTYARSEAKGTCVTNGDAAAIEAKIDAFVLDLDTELNVGSGTNPSRCESDKIKAAAKKAVCKSALEAKQAAKGGTIDPAKVAKCEAAFSKSFAKSEGGGACNTTGDAATIEAKVDAFVSDVDTELPSVPTTSTTTSTGEPTTSTTTTTIAPPVCGNGVTEGFEQCDDNNNMDGDGCSANCELEGSTCSPVTAARRVVRIDINTPEPLAGVQVDLEYPQVHTSIPGQGDSTLVRSRLTVFPSGGINAINDRNDDLSVILSNATAFINSGPLYELSFDQCTALDENMCNRNQNIISCCDNPADPNQFGDLCTRGLCDDPPTTSCTRTTGAECTVPGAAHCLPVSCTSDASCKPPTQPADLGLCVFRCPANPPICPNGNFPTSSVGPCFGMVCSNNLTRRCTIDGDCQSGGTCTVPQPPGGCPGDNACISQTVSTTCAVSEPVDGLGQPVEGVTCSVVITEVP